MKFSTLKVVAATEVALGGRKRLGSQSVTNLLNLHARHAGRKLALLACLRSTC